MVRLHCTQTQHKSDVIGYSILPQSETIEPNQFPLPITLSQLHKSNDLAHKAHPHTTHISKHDFPASGRRPAKCMLLTIIQTSKLNFKR